MSETAGAALVAALEDAEAQTSPDLSPGALAIAAVEYPHLGVAHYLARVAAIADQALDRVNREAGVEGPLHARVDAINQCLFGTLGFRGNRDQYADVRNSCLNQVIDRRTGIPITLAVVYLDVARRAGLAGDGVSFPGHFLVRVRDRAHADRAAGLVVDPFNEGAILTEPDCRALLKRHDDTAVYSPDLLAPATRRQIFVRMLVNLKRLYVHGRSFPQALVVTDALLSLAPSSLAELRDRGLLSYHLHDYGSALKDLEEYLRLISLTDRSEDSREETTQVWDHVKSLRRRVAALN